MQAVVLASSSQYRARLLTRLGINFSTLSPDVDESALADENPGTLACRLARLKADAVQPLINQPSVIIASDQVAACHNLTLGKPGTVANACAQLASMSGQTVSFHTALHLLELPSGKRFYAENVTLATLRVLDETSIARYVAQDQPLDCAGSFKVESLGISLFESVRCDDPTALVGLPLIKLCEGLRQFGFTVP